MRENQRFSLDERNQLNIVCEYCGELCEDPESDVDCPACGTEFGDEVNDIEMQE